MDYDIYNVSGNASMFLPDVNVSTSCSMNVDRQDSFSSTLNHVVLPVVFTIGIIGNTLNLVVFCRQRIRRGLGHIERSATAGLVSLAVSDLLFCLVGLPSVIQSESIAFYYRMYRSALVNIFLFSSTWVIVLISLERYLAICWPFKARVWIRVHRTIAIHATVFVVAIILNIPLFLRYRGVHQMPCGACVCSIWLPGFYLRQKTFAHAHRIVYSILGTVLPLLLLIFTNCCLIRELYQARVSSTSSTEERSSSNRTTVTLIAIVLLFLFLVFPSMILEFLQINFDSPISRLASLITNLTQAIKFSCNFLLYCALNKQFRQHMSRWRCQGRDGEVSRSEQTTSRYRLVTVHV